MAYTQLTRFKMVCKRIHSKKYHFVEQGLCELETEEAKMDSNLTMVETAGTLVVESLSLAVHLLPLADLFFFYSSFF